MRGRAEMGRVLNCERFRVEQLVRTGENVGEQEEGAKEGRRA